MKTVIWVLLPLVMLVSCGQQEDAAKPATTVDLLTTGVDSLGIARSSEPKLFVGEALYEHINGGAEVYHLYDFVEVATAYYKRDTVELLVDFYRFQTADDAFGLFSNLRPEEPNPVPLGVEGFAGSGSVTFVKGAYMVKLTGFDESAETTMMIRDLAAAMESTIEGARQLPSLFANFPSANRVAHSEKINAESFLGQQALTDVYSGRYYLGEDTLTLFLTKDVEGAKFAAWSERAGGTKVDAVDEFALPFTEGKVVAIDNSYYGVIVGGLKGEFVAGAVGYNQKHQQFLVDWLNTLP
jgi:hypothetical protein